jgi:hypothetical protein
VWLTDPAVSFAVRQLLAKFLLFQLFVLVIVEAYNILLGEAGGVPEPLLVAFMEEWRRIDPRASGLISMGQVRGWRGLWAVCHDRI